MLVETINGQEAGTESTVLGPFHDPGEPLTSPAPLEWIAPRGLIAVLEPDLRTGVPGALFGGQ
jgi:hypothetical protein